MYFIIIPKKLVDERGVFADHTRLSDGSAVVPMSETRFTRFSYGDVKILNEEDTNLLVANDKKNQKEE